VNIGDNILRNADIGGNWPDFRQALLEHAVLFHGLAAHQLRVLKLRQLKKPAFCAYLLGAVQNMGIIQAGSSFTKQCAQVLAGYESYGQKTLRYYYSIPPFLKPNFSIVFYIIYFKIYWNWCCHQPFP